MKEKGNSIFYVIIAICVTLVIALCGFIIYRHSQNEMTDAIRFKNEYESLNDIDTNDGKNKYPSIEIADDNPIVYKSPKEILDVLNEKEAIVYFGYASCPWCRNIIEVMLDVAQDKGIKKIYYVDIKDVRDEYVFAGSIKPKQTKKGSDAYYEILAFFGDLLEDYYIADEKGNRYDTGVTRLYAPAVVRVSNKRIEKMHVSTVESHENPFIKMNDEQRNELYTIYTDLMQVDDSFCGEDAC